MKFQKPQSQQPSYLTQRYAWRQKPGLPLNKDALLYPRVSTVKQLNNVSAELQTKEDGELLRIAHELGWLYESEWKPGCGKGRIRTFSQDMAVAGRLRMEDRIGFKLMLQAIISGEAGVVICIEVDRLFRDKYGQEAGKFMEICEKYCVIVITPRQIYDFRNSGDVSDFKEDVARAWDYMQRQIYDKLIYAQNYLSETGRVGRGQNVSIGYILDRDPRSPMFRHLLPYSPHAKIKADLYVRYRELGDNMGRLYKELKARPFVFPDFPEDFDLRHAKSIGLKKVPGGWTIANRSGLTRMMCDIANIGWMRHGDDIVRNEDGTPKRCHDPIVPQELFWYVFKRHSGFLPDGTPNPNTQKWRDRRRIEPVDAMLRLVIGSVDPARYHVVSTTTISMGKRQAEGCYSLYNPQDGINSFYAYIQAREVDNIFWKLLLPHLEHTADFERYADQEAAAIASREHERKEIEAQIEACDAAITRQQAKLLKVNADPLIEVINEEVHQQLEEKARLQARLEAFLEGDGTYTKQMREWSRLLAGIEDFNDLEQRSTVEERQQLAVVFAPKISLELLSPRVLRMVVHWRIPFWGCQEAMWISGTAHGKFWTDNERARFVGMAGQVSNLELLQAFPLRSWQALRKQALNKGLKSLTNVGPLSEKSGDWHDTLCWEDWQRVETYGLEPATIRSTHLESC